MIGGARGHKSSWGSPHPRAREANQRLLLASNELLPGFESRERAKYREIASAKTHDRVRPSEKIAAIVHAYEDPAISEEFKLTSLGLPSLNSFSDRVDDPEGIHAALRFVYGTLLQVLNESLQSSLLDSSSGLSKRSVALMADFARISYHFKSTTCSWPALLVFITELSSCASPAFLRVALKIIDRFPCVFWETKHCSKMVSILDKALHHDDTKVRSSALSSLSSVVRLWDEQKDVDKLAKLIPTIVKIAESNESTHYGSPRWCLSHLAMKLGGDIVSSADEVALSSAHSPLSLCLFSLLVYGLEEGMVGRQPFDELCVHLLEHAQSAEDEAARERLATLIANVAANMIDPETGEQTWHGVIHFIEAAYKSDNNHHRKMAARIIQLNPGIFGAGAEPEMVVLLAERLEADYDDTVSPIDVEWSVDEVNSENETLVEGAEIRDQRP